MIATARKGTQLKPKYFLKELYYDMKINTITFIYMHDSVYQFYHFNCSKTSNRNRYINKVLYYNYTLNTLQIIQLSLKSPSCEVHPTSNNRSNYTNLYLTNHLVKQIRLMWCHVEIACSQNVTVCNKEFATNP